MNNPRGTAVLEGIGAIVALTLFVSVLLTCVYLWFARGWIQYQSEQSLYCLAEGRPTFVCTRALTRNVERFLPYGKISRIRLFKERGKYALDMEWKWEWKQWAYKLRSEKELKIRGIQRKVLGREALF